MASVSSFVGKALMLVVCGASAIRVEDDLEGKSRQPVETGLAPSHSAQETQQPRLYGNQSPLFRGSPCVLRRRGDRIRSVYFRRYQFFQLTPRQPAFVAVARITEAFLKRFVAVPGFRLPPRMRRLNHLHIFRFQRPPRLVVRD